MMRRPCPGSGKLPAKPPTLPWQKLAICPVCAQTVLLTRDRLTATHSRPTLAAFRKNAARVAAGQKPKKGLK
jgi:hypothetical protein